MPGVTYNRQELAFPPPSRLRAGLYAPSRLQDLRLDASFLEVPMRLRHTGSSQHPTPGHRRHLLACVRVVYLRPRPLYFVYFHFLPFRHLRLDVVSHPSQLLLGFFSDIFHYDFLQVRWDPLQVPPHTRDSQVCTHNPL